jgi:FtsP/CotA-like multicopper oxidase with cupredoxin domain
MRLIRVKRGDVVKLKWTTDKAASIHLHGYDLEKQLVPGAEVEMVFAARATGRFTIEPHIPKQAGGHAHGEPLVTIEVHP